MASLKNNSARGCEFLAVGGTNIYRPRLQPATAGGARQRKGGAEPTADGVGGGLA